MIGLSPIACTSSNDDEKTVFIEDSGKLHHDDRLPVDKVWKDPSVSLLSYDRIMIKDVRTDLQLDKTWLQRNNMRALAGLEDEDIKELAAYMTDSFRNAIRSSKCRMTLADKPGPKTVVLEMAIVKVVHDNPALNTAVTAGAAVIKPISICLIPVKSVAGKAADSPLRSSIAVEGKVTDSISGKTIAMFELKGKEDTALLDLKKYTSAYGNVRAIIDRWPPMLVEVINKRPLETGEKVAGQGEDGNTVSVIKF